jgi:prepilin-type N-terminal cleavage/methylation domain-containing protein
MKLSFRQISKLLRGFTLMELLVVLAIIGILMSLMFPAVNGALNSARAASAKNDVVQIANATTMYQTEYGTWPTNATRAAFTVGGGFLNALMGTNTRRIVFLEVGEAKRNRSGLSNQNFVDPWGGVYRAAVNDNYAVPANLSVGDPATTINRQVGVWNTNSNQRFRRNSWD